MSEQDPVLGSPIDDVDPVETVWTVGRIITKDRPTQESVRLRMLVDDRQRHAPGQHYLIRLRAPDGYTAQRSYSVASDEHDPLVEFLIERLPGGEVSEFIADQAEVGDVLELRGPIGRWFVWDGHTPAFCLVGGSGVVPAVAMLRTARRSGRAERVSVAAVGRSTQTLPYVEELGNARAFIAFTRQAGSQRPAGPPTREEVLPLLGSAEIFYVCGSPRFAEYAESILIECGVDPSMIRVEQFGATQ